MPNQVPGGELPVGYFNPEDAARVWNAIHWLERSGMMTGKGQKTPYNPPPERPIYVKNVSGYEIPVFGCVQATGTELRNDQCFLTVDRPVDVTGVAGPFFLNLFHNIPATTSGTEYQYGLATAGPHANALADIDEPAGTRMRPIIDSFKLEKGDGPFLMIGPNDGQFMPDEAQRVKFSGSGTALYIMQFTITSVSGCSAEVTVNEIPCAAGPLPDVTNCTATVYATQPCLVLAVGLVGWAAWVELCDPLVTSSCPTPPDCYWSIFSLCCEV